MSDSDNESDNSEDSRGISIVTHTTLKENKFQDVKEFLLTLGGGINKEYAKSTGAMLNESIKSVELVQTAGPFKEQILGRSLVANIQNMFKFTLGNVLEKVVETNYPIDRFIEEFSDEIKTMDEEMKSLVVQVEDMGGERPAPNYDRAKRRADLAWREKVIRASQQVLSATVPETPTQQQQSQEPPVIQSKKSKKKSSETEGQIDVTNTAKEAFFIDFEKAFLEEEDVYEELKKKKFDLESRRRAIDSKMSRIVVINSLLEGVRGAVTLLTNKVKACVSTPHYEKIKRKLQGMVVIEATRATITNPHDNNILSGMYQILKNEYFTATLAQFNVSFAELFMNQYTATELLKDPLKAARFVEKGIAEWVAMDFWHFLTPDIFFTNLLLVHLPSSTLKEKCVVAVEDFIKKKCAKGSTLESKLDQSEMPVFKFLEDYIKQQQNSSSYRSTFYNPSPKVVPPGASLRYGNQGNVEMAAAVSPEQVYTSEVEYEKGVAMRNDQMGGMFYYTATKSVCPVCYGKGPGAPHKPKCWQGSCHKCGLFGHKQSMCAQDPAVFKKDGKN